MPEDGPEDGEDIGVPNQYQLRGNGVRITYFPTGAGPLTHDGRIILIYQDSHRSLVFRGAQVQTVVVADFGTCVTATLERTLEIESVAVTLLIPTVFLADGGSTSIRTVLVTTVHTPGVIGRQRENHTVVALAGKAWSGPLPL
ncbi:hypothetical protein [Mycobacterium parmense]|uniref:hypothetical protein n=1 Tax=Mycobacterium parmense TaxID=185642 RepID=UPI00111C2661|nr:hypothetical protein [Mycobacterium parmense]MCV7349390.1 hypothetical protein [Mycobacterium parmense]